MESLSFYRKMANSNIELMKKYKYNEINRLKYEGIVELYQKNNLDFEQDINRLKKFNSITPINTDIIASETLPKTETSNYTIYLSLLIIPIVSYFIFNKRIK
jgi:hypothetical protein